MTNTLIHQEASAIIMQAVSNECDWAGCQSAEDLSGHNPSAVKAEMEHIKDCMDAALWGEEVAERFDELMEATDELERIAAELRRVGFAGLCKRIAAVEANVRAAHTNIQAAIGRIDTRE